MEFTVKRGSPAQQRTDCIVVGVFEKGVLSPAARLLDEASDGALTATVKNGDIKGKVGDALMVPAPAGITPKRVLLVGCGPEGEVSASDYRKLAAAAMKALKGTAAKQAVFALNELAVKDGATDWKMREAVVAAGNVFYYYDATKGEKARKEARKELPPLKRLGLLLADEDQPADADRGVAQGRAMVEGMDFTRELANLPGNVCTPTYLAKQAEALDKAYGSVTTTVLDEKEMKRLGMGALLSVSRGSRQPAKLIVMEYKGGKAKEQPVVLVGKGLTFDAGGISLKPAPAMDEMKYDMGGGAGVFGVMKAVAELELPINVIGVVPSSENLPDGDANKPGDIVTSMSGQTIEILNTDAEGRLILCDALTYVERFNPAAVVDIATLTGACIIALGKQASGVLANDDDLARALLEAGQNTGDRGWQLPLWPEYQEQLKSNFADMANIGGREAGTITAACFLSRYTDKYRWAHLDIAGTAWVSGAEKGATGRPVPMLTQFLVDYADNL